MKKSNAIIDKIKKLIVKQESAAELGSIHEAEAFAAKVQTLLAKYNISLSEISFEELKENIITFYASSKISSVSDTLGYYIYRAIAKYNWCRAYMGGHRVTLVGSKENIEVVTMIYNIVLPVFVAEGKRIYKRDQAGFGKGLDSFQREFIMGCLMGLGRKLEEEREKFERENATCTGLIIRNDKAVEEFVQVKMGKIKNTVKKVKTTKTWEDGFQVGHNVQIIKNLR